MTAFTTHSVCSVCPTVEAKVRPTPSAAATTVEPTWMGTPAVAGLYVPRHVRT